MTTPAEQYAVPSMGTDAYWDAPWPGLFLVRKVES